MDEMDEIWPDGFFWISGQIFLDGFFPDGSRAVYAAYASKNRAWNQTRFL